MDVGQKVERSKGKIVQIAQWNKGRKNKKSKEQEVESEKIQIMYFYCYYLWLVFGIVLGDFWSLSLFFQTWAKKKKIPEKAEFENISKNLIFLYSSILFLQYFGEFFLSQMFIYYCLLVCLFFQTSECLKEIMSKVWTWPFFLELYILSK